MAVAVLTGCAASSSASANGDGTATSSSKSKNEGGVATAVDVGKYRTVFPAASASSTPSTAAAVTPTKDLREQVEVLMDSVALMNKNIKYANGYRILAFTGNERKAAMDLRNSIIQRLPAEKDYLTYKQPTYQLKVGDFMSRVEAQLALSKIKDLIPNALIVPETINIPKNF
ncbi:sporulation protein [Nibribacter ruber]|uniref:Sporulation protein n=1 Tax=Nibribacter ruber TaxID=2698458 RepID=A0A6P1P531_9BACT|nr:sporulation protein [Nibribacter ruber]